MRTGVSHYQWTTTSADRKNMVPLCMTERLLLWCGLRCTHASMHARCKTRLDHKHAWYKITTLFLWGVHCPASNSGLLLHYVSTRTLRQFLLHTLEADLMMNALLDLGNKRAKLRCSGCYCYACMSSMLVRCCCGVGRFPCYPARNSAFPFQGLQRIWCYSGIQPPHQAIGKELTELFLVWLLRTLLGPE